MKQGCTNPGRQVVVVTEFCTVTPNVCASSMELLLATFLAAKILRWLIPFGKYVPPPPSDMKRSKG